LEPVRDRYSDFGATLAREKLIEHHGITLGLEMVRRQMVAASFRKPRSQRAAQIHQPRSRRACVGELIQIDGSDHAWLEDRSKACAEERLRCAPSGTADEDLDLTFTWRVQRKVSISLTLHPDRVRYQPPLAGTQLETQLAERNGLAARAHPHSSTVKIYAARCFDPCWNHAHESELLPAPTVRRAFICSRTA